MKGILHEILAREKGLAIAASDLSQFTLGPGQTIECDFIADDMTWSLLCLDAPTRQAVFVELPGDIDLSDAPFAFIPQFEKSQRLILVSFDDLARLADAAPCPDNVVMVYSIGRCGSTLVSKIFAEIPGVWSVSEPDPFANMVGISAENDRRFDPEDIPSLIRASTRLAYRPTQSRGHDTLVIKHRSQFSFFLNEMASALPDAINLYLHREAVGWANSFYQFAQKLGHDPDDPNPERLHSIWNIMTCGSDESQLLEFLGASEFPTTFTDVLAGCWHNNLGQFAVGNGLGMKMQPFSYHQINNERRETVERLLSVCGLDAKHVDGAMRAYEEDSQKGTSAAREIETKPFSTDQRQRIADLVAKGAKPEILNL